MEQTLGALHASSSSIIRSALPKLQAFHRDEGGNSNEVLRRQLSTAHGWFPWCCECTCLICAGEGTQEPPEPEVATRGPVESQEGLVKKSKEHTGIFEKVVLWRILPQRSLKEPNREPAKEVTPDTVFHPTPRLLLLQIPWVNKSDWQRASCTNQTCWKF